MKRILSSITFAAIAIGIAVGGAYGCSQEQVTLKKDVIRLKSESIGFNIVSAVLVWSGDTTGVEVTEYWSYVSTVDGGNGVVTRYRASPTFEIDFARTFSSATTVDVVDVAASRAGYAVLLKSDSGIDIEGQLYSGSAVFAVFDHCNTLVYANVINPYLPHASYEPAALAMDVDGRVAVVGNSVGPIDLGNGVIGLGGGSGYQNLQPLLAVYDPAGAVAFSPMSTGADAPDGLTFAGVDFDSAGRVVIAGAHRSQAGYGPCSLGGIPYGKPHVVRFNADGSCAGAHEWPVTVNIELQHSRTYELSVAQGSIVIRGVLPFSEGIDFGSGYLYGPGQFLARFDESMNLVYAKKNDPIDAMAARDDGHLLMTTAFSGTYDPGTGPLTSPGSTSIAVIELDENGTPIDAMSVYPTNLEQYPTGLAAFPTNSLLEGRIMLVGRYYTYLPWTYDFVVGLTSL